MVGLWLLSWSNYFTNAFESFSRLNKKIYRAVRSVLVSDNYIFFKGIDKPYLENKVNINSVRSAEPAWLYDPEHHFFVEWATTGGTTRRLPILSLEIVDENVVYDLTDFIELIRVYSNGSTPSIAHLVNAWSLSSELVLNPELGYKVRYMTDTADTFEVPYNKMPLSPTDEDDDNEKVD
jgi:hypothetical protein